MPMAAPRPCTYPGCCTLVARGLCLVHRRSYAKQLPKRLRGDAGMRRRRLFLNAHPLCVHCTSEGRTSAAQEVDHVVPLSEGGPDEWDNLQALCRPHHAAKTLAERRLG